MTTLVAWTRTTAARSALDWAIAREYLLDRHVILCHVAAPADERPISRAALEDLAATLQQDRTGIRFTAELLHGDPAEQLERRCLLDGTLLVLGTDTRNEHPRRFEHSLGMAITQRGRITAVIVPVDAKHGAAHIAVGVDGSSASLAALEFAAAEADRCSETLLVIRSWQLTGIEEDSADVPSSRTDFIPENRRLRTLDALAPARERFPHLRVELRFTHGDTVHNLLASASDAGLLVLGTDVPALSRAGERISHALVMATHTALAVVPPHPIRPLSPLPTVGQGAPVSYPGPGAHPRPEITDRI
ncbi:universal stress protein [Rathayibacter sp. VKM Ac-2801]|uniref:universal stress protein n=1 Tax=Rathayibacter sp. VKM Ac-2801 TaxID=2609255 RepID=UPI00131FF195|nr:universal stress protein [Rathayibacter sp. VKM Ac-2801]QHC69551.1 universal stress protein [Rathayibacter sp. VKM Ac-2801]